MIWNRVPQAGTPKLFRDLSILRRCNSCRRRDEHAQLAHCVGSSLLFLGSDRLRNPVFGGFAVSPLACVEPPDVRHPDVRCWTIREGKAMLRDLLDAAERRYEELDRTKPPATCRPWRSGHTGKDKDRGVRGSSAIPGDIASTATPSKPRRSKRQTRYVLYVLCSQVSPRTAFAS